MSKASEVNVLDYCSPRSHRTGMTPNHGTLKLTREGEGEGGDGGTLSLKKVIQNIPLDAPPLFIFTRPALLLERIRYIYIYKFAFLQSSFMAWRISVIFLTSLHFFNVQKLSSTPVYLNGQSCLFFIYGRRTHSQSF